MAGYMRDTQFYLLPDKRRLCYAEYGDYRGFPILYCHGFPASRLEAKLADSEANRHGVRVIAIDRPGIGQSDYQVNRSIKSWPQDVMALMRHLGIEKFSVIGISGGSPYAMSCAYFLREHIFKVGVVSGLGGLSDRQMANKLRKPFALIVNLFSISSGLGLWVTKQLIGRWFKAFPGSVISVIKILSSENDQRVLDDPTICSCIRESFQEAFRQGSGGAAWDFFLYTKPWGFDLMRISVETYLWHGDKDRTVPLIMAEQHARTIPGARLTVYPGEGHFSTPIRHLGEILVSLRA